MFSAKPKITDNAAKSVTKKFGKQGFKAFEKAMNKGMVGPKGQSGIKALKNMPNGYGYEVKLFNKQYANYRLYGNKNEVGEIVFDYFGKALH